MSHQPVSHGKKIKVERIQTGIRLEKRMFKVLKALAEYHDLTLSELLEAVLLHAFEGQPIFGDRALEKIAALKTVYDIDYDLSAVHQFTEDE